MHIYWDAKYITYKKIIKELNNYWYKKYGIKAAGNIFYTPNITLSVQRHYMMLLIDSVDATELKKILKIIFNKKEVTGYIHDIKSDYKLVQQIVKEIPNLKIMDPCKKEYSKDEIDDLIRFVNNLYDLAEPTFDIFNESNEDEDKLNKIVKILEDYKQWHS